MATPEPYSDNYINDVKPQKGFFDQFRIDNYPTLYGSIRTAVTSDVMEAGWIFAACILAFSLFLIIPGVRRWRSRISTCVRIVIAVGFWVFIILCNFGEDWEVSDVREAKTQYKALLTEEITADIGVHIGLRSVNITLLGKPRVQIFVKDRMNETIDYNEKFSWDSRGWTLGRAAFGLHAGRFNQEFRAAQRRGLPYPILWIAEYFTMDGEGFRWGRYYLQAGYFTHILVWTAWAMWMLAVILFNLVPRHGAYFSCLTGVTLLIANIIYGSLRNTNALVIPVNFKDCANADYTGDNRGCFMKFHYAWCFWLCLAVGICSILIGIAVIILDVLIPEQLAEFFNVDITGDMEEFIISEQDMEAAQSVKRKGFNKQSHVYTSRKVVLSNVSSLQPPDEVSSANGEEEQQITNDQTHEMQSNSSNYIQGYRKRTASGFSRFQRSSKTISRSPKNSAADDRNTPRPVATYVNAAYQNVEKIQEDE